MLLAGDIGGTKTDLAVFSTETGPRKPLAQAEFPSSKYSSLEEIVREFLTRVSFPIDRACFDVAGPVIGGRVKATNLPWVVEEAKLAQEMDISNVRLINDLEAIALAVPILEPDDLETLNPGEPVNGGSVAVIAPGTGLGQAFLTWDGQRYRAYASEGGHADFAPTNALQIGLLQYLQERFGHVSYERVCSGIGIPSIYEYLRDRAYAPETPALAARLAATTDQTPLIVESAVRPGEPDALGLATIQTFVEVLGAEAGNLALKVLATGGVYLGGGMPLHVLPVLKGGSFLNAFRDKGRFAELLGKMPIHVITCQAALVGAAHYGLEMTGR